MTRRHRAEITNFALKRRTGGSFVASDNLITCMQGENGLLDFFLLLARRYFPGAINWQVDWPVSEQLALVSTLKCVPPCRLDGDSWLLPLFFALACAQWERPWPTDILASGAVRTCRGLRCVSVGRAIFKLRRAQTAGKVCLLPKSNVTQLQRRGIDLSLCLPLPSNMDKCLDIWRRHV